MKVLLLFDSPVPAPAGGDYSKLLLEPGWESERHVFRTLQSLGHQVRCVGLYRGVDALLYEVNQSRPDVVFNLCEALDGDRALEPHIASLLELLKVRYTGADAHTLKLCKDKGLTKKILTFHGIRVPHFVVSQVHYPLKNLLGWNFESPAIVKPLSLDGSEGISSASVVRSKEQAMERIRYIHRHYGVDAILEEFIEGRELYVGLLGTQELTVFPSREIFFSHKPKSGNVATFRAKWDDDYRSRWGIRNGKARKIDANLQENILRTCRAAYKLFQMKGYGRIDLRVTPSGEVVFLEANPNPSIAKDEDFAMSAQSGGLKYDELISKILTLA